MQTILQLYRFIFCRPWFYSLNLHLYKLSLRGIGVLNSEGPRVTGEQWFFDKLAVSGLVKTVVDVGANTDVCGAEQLTAANIFAFEPHPETYKKLQTAIRQNHQTHVRCFPYGLSDKKGNVTLWDFADDAELKVTQPTSTLASLDKTVIEKFHGQKAQGFTIKVETLDNIATKLSLKTIDLLKIDTEGHEYRVLSGAKKLLQQNRIRIIQFEFNEMNAFSRTYLKDFIDLLPNHTFCRLLPTGLFPLGKYRPLTHEIFGFQNIIALPNFDKKISTSLF